MAKKNTFNEWVQWVRNYFLCPEALQLYLLVGTGIVLKQRLNTPMATVAQSQGSDTSSASTTGITVQPQSQDNSLLPSGATLLKTLKDYAHIWAPAGTTVATNSLNAYLMRCRENRDRDYKQDEESNKQLLSEMEVLKKQGDMALQQAQHHLAFENFSASEQLFQQFYHGDNSSRAKQLSLEFFYKKAISLCGLNQNDEAKTLIDIALSDNKYTNVMQARLQLLNLRGVISFKESGMPKNAWLHEEKESNEKFIKRNQSLLDESKKYFMESFAVDPGQSAIYFYIKYIEGRFDLLSKHILSDPASNKKSFSYSEDDFILEYLRLAAAEACYFQKNYAQAILLYQDYLRQFNVCPNNFIDLAMINLKCFFAYKALLLKGESSIYLYEQPKESSDGKDTAENMRVALKPLPKEDVKVKAINYARAAKNYLAEGMISCEDAARLSQTHHHYHNGYALLEQGITTPEELFTETDISSDERKKIMESKALHLEKANASAKHRGAGCK